MVYGDQGAWRPKVGGGGGPCPMAGIIRAVPEVIPTIFAHFCSAQRVSAFTANELDPMGGLCRVANSVCCPPALPSALPPSLVPSQLYVFRSADLGRTQSQLYTTHSFIDSHKWRLLEI